MGLLVKGRCELCVASVLRTFGVVAALAALAKDRQALKKYFVSIKNPGIFVKRLICSWGMFLWLSHNGLLVPALNL